MSKSESTVTFLCSCINVDRSEFTVLVLANNESVGWLFSYCKQVKLAYKIEKKRSKGQLKQVMTQ